MQFSSIAILASLALPAYSQSDLPNLDTLAAQIPACGYSCLTKAAETVNCSLTDYSCLCGLRRPALVTAATPCIARGCSIQDSLTTQKFGTKICSELSAGSSSSISPGTTATSSDSSSATPSSSVSSQESSSSSSTSSGENAASSTSSATSGTTAPVSPTTSTPGQVSDSAGFRREAMGGALGAVLLIAFAL